MSPHIQQQIDRAVAILLEAGAREVYVFGSVLPEEALPGREPRDLDLAVEGLPPEAYYKTVGKLLHELTLPVDLIDLDTRGDFGEFLRKHGKLKRVA